MGERKSFHQPGHVHELTFSTYKKHHVFQLAGCAEAFLHTLATAAHECDWKIHAYVVMPNHVHLLMTPRDDDTIAFVLKRIKMSATYAVWPHLETACPELAARMTVMNARKVKEHRLWQRGGGYDRNMVEQGAIRNAVEYIHANPIRRGLAVYPADYPYSSARAYEGQDVLCPTVYWSRN